MSFCSVTDGDGSLCATAGTLSAPNAAMLLSSMTDEGASHPTHPDQDRTVSAALVVAIAMALAFAATNGLHDAANSIATLVMTHAARPRPAVVLAAAGQHHRAAAHRTGGGGHDRGDRHGAERRSRRGARRRAHGRGRLEHDHVVARPAFELRPRAARRSRRRRTGRRRNVGRQLGRLRRVATRGRDRRDHGARDRARRRIRGRVRRRPRRATAHAPRDQPHPRPGARRTVGDVGRARDQPRRQRCAEGRRRRSRSCCSRRARSPRSTRRRGWSSRAGPRSTVGTAFGGWPIIRTIGARIVRLRPIDALASQTGSTAALLGATLTGAPVSTTQVVASSVVGVGRRQATGYGTCAGRSCAPC